MPDALRDRVFEVLGDSSSLEIFEALCLRERSQADLVRDLHMPQSVVSRSLKNLRLVGLVTAESPRGTLRVRATDASAGLFRAANTLASEILRSETADQKAATESARRRLTLLASDDERDELSPREDAPRAGA